MDFTQKCLSHKLFERHPETPLLLCRKPDLNRKNVLLCVDGSESAYAMSRFVASMLIGEPHLVTLCRIINDNAAERHASTEIFNRCEEIMSKEGFNLSQLRYMIYPSHSAKNAILDNATWGKFAVVATGTTDKNPIKRLLYGSTTNFLISELSGSVLWVHP